LCSCYRSYSVQLIDLFAVPILTCLIPSDFNKARYYKAKSKAKARHSKAKVLGGKTKTKDLSFKAKAKNFCFKAKAKGRGINITGWSDNS